MVSIFITGAGKGIGRAIAERFATAGWDVAGVTRAAGDVESLNQMSSSGTVRFWCGDATDAAGITAIADAHFGNGLDLLVNNAGGFD